MIKPMLGVSVDLENLTFPVYVSTKLDGVRAMVYDGKVYSRTGKEIPNKHVQKLFSEFEGVDGELIVGSPCEKNVFQKTTSGVMTIEGEPEVTLYAFDCLNCDGGIDKRYDKLLKIVSKAKNIKVVQQIQVNNLEELLQFEKETIEQGYEGIMIRNPKSEYKHGRSTNREMGLLKLKRFKDSEAEIIGIEQLVKITGELADELGSVIVKDMKNSVEFSIGSGFSEEQRIDIWKNQDNFIGEIVKYKYFEVGTKDKPRFPVFIGFRNKIDFD